MLSGDDYRRAAGSLLNGARQSLLKLAAPYVAGAIAAVLVIVGLAVWLLSNGTSQLVAGVAAAAGALGISWRSASAMLQRAAANLEQPLWGAAVNAAVAEAVTYLPPADAFRDRLLTQTPLCLRAVGQLQQRPQTELVKALAGRGGLPLKLADTLTVRWWRARRCAPTADEVAYWLGWATAAGYVAPAGDGYRLSEEGERIARIPPNERDATRAALSAVRPSALAQPPSTDSDHEP